MGGPEPATTTEPADEPVSANSDRPMRTCLVLSVSFTFVYTAYLAIQNLQSSLNQEANLGVTSLCVLYATIIVFGTQAPLLIQLIGPKRVLVLAWLIHCVYTTSNFYPTWATLIPSSALLGAIAGPMWTAQGIYITAAGERHAALTAAGKDAGELVKHVHSVLSRFNGIFFAFYELTQITGNLISSLVLSQGSYNSTKSDADATAVCGPDDCPAVAVSSNTTAPAIEKPESSIIYSMLGVFLGCNICGLLLTLVCLPRDAHKRVEESKTFPENSDNILVSSSLSSLSSSSVSSSAAFKDMFKCFKMAIDSRMLLLMPLFAAQAMAIGVLYADYTKAYISCAIGVRWVGYVMTSYGLCTAVMAVSINTLATRLGRVVLFLVAVVADMGSLVVMLVWRPQADESIAFFFLVPAVSGIAGGIMQAQFSTLVGQVFASNITPAFAVYHTSKAAAFTVTFLLSNFLCLKERLYLAILLYTLGLVGYLITELRLRRSKPQQYETTAVEEMQQIKV